ncbi:MAG TPA: RNA-binding protein [Rhizomicrobium sp.]|jgi:hypothetical protein|nr:RNA-binding protein [Rhizomicrobium sp.]
MTFAPAFAPVETFPEMRARRCIVTNAVLNESQLVRFAVDPEGTIVPDVAAKLPGRGMWISARRDAVDRAVAKGHFSRAAKIPVSVPLDLSDRIEALLVGRMSGDIGLARRSGHLVVGFDTVARALAGEKPLSVLLEASDGALNGRRKLLGMIRTRPPAVIDCLTVAELSLALGRENVVHAALKLGRLSERLIADASRLRGFRPAPRCVMAPEPAAAGPDPAGNKG